MGSDGAFSFSTGFASVTKSAMNVTMSAASTLTAATKTGISKLQDAVSSDKSEPGLPGSVPEAVAPLAAPAPVPAPVSAPVPAPVPGPAAPLAPVEASAPKSTIGAFTSSIAGTAKTGFTKLTDAVTHKTGSEVPPVPGAVAIPVAPTGNAAGAPALPPAEAKTTLGSIGASITGTAKTGFTKLHDAVVPGGDGKKSDPASSGDDTQWLERCGLSKKQRLYGFATCLGVGFILSFLSFLTWASPTRFAVIYTTGNIVSLCGSLFLMGPMRYLRSMFHEKRRLSAIAFLASMVLTLIAALAIKSVILSIVMALIQVACMIYYMLSYIPFGRQMAKAAVSQCFKRGG